MCHLISIPIIFQIEYYRKIHVEIIPHLSKLLFIAIPQSIADYIMIKIVISKSTDKVTITIYFTVLQYQ